MTGTAPLLYLYALGVCFHTLSSAHTAVITAMCAWIRELLQGLCGFHDRLNGDSEELIEFISRC